MYAQQLHWEKSKGKWSETMTRNVYEKFLKLDIDKAKGMNIATNRENSLINYTSQQKFNAQ